MPLTVNCSIKERKKKNIMSVGVFILLMPFNYQKKKEKREEISKYSKHSDYKQNLLIIAKINQGGRPYLEPTQRGKAQKKQRGERTNKTECQYVP